MRLLPLIFVLFGLLPMAAQTPVATLNANYRPLHFGDYNYDTARPGGGGGNLVIGAAGLNSDWGTSTSLTRILEGEPWSHLKVGLTISGLPATWRYKVNLPVGGAFESMRIGGGTSDYDGLNGVWLQDYKNLYKAGPWDTTVTRPNGAGPFETAMMELGGSCQFTGNQFLGKLGLYWRDLPIKVDWFDSNGAAKGSQTLLVRYSVRIGPGRPTLSLESNGDSLHFGTIIASDRAGTVELGTDGRRTALGGVTLYAGGDQAKAGAWRIVNTTPDRTYGGMQLTLPELVTLRLLDASGTPIPGGATMTARGFGTTLTVAGQTRTVISGTPGVFASVPSSTPIPFSLGGTLDVAAGQKPGRYRGEYTLTLVNL